MAAPDDTLKPTTDGNITPPPAGTDFQPASSLEDSGVEFQGAQSSDTTTASLGNARQTLKDNAQKLQAQAGDKARGLAEDGKARAGDALGQISQLLNDAATQVDDKVGAQYGQYARSAASQVQGFADQLSAKSIDEVVEDVRGLVRKSPAVAIGTAAAVGFVLARLLSAGLDQNNQA